jgi:hypothetical protein
MVRRMGTVVLMVPAWPESGFLGHAARLRPTTRGGREVNAGFSVGKGEQKVEMTFGDFGASVSASALLAGELYAAGR